MCSSLAAVGFLAGLWCLLPVIRAALAAVLGPYGAKGQPPHKPPGAAPRPLASPPGERTPETFPPQPDELLRLLGGRPHGLSLREVCEGLWPAIRWQALFENEDSVTERVREGGMTAAQMVDAEMMKLVAVGQVRLGRPRANEVDGQAAIVYESMQAPPADLPGGEAPSSPTNPEDPTSDEADLFARIARIDAMRDLPPGLRPSDQEAIRGFYKVLGVLVWSGRRAGSASFTPASGPPPICCRRIRPCRRTCFGCWPPRSRHLSLPSRPDPSRRRTRPHVGQRTRTISSSTASVRDPLRAAPPCLEALIIVSATRG